MKIGSLFSGIGGLELGLERAIPGAHTVFQVEQDSYARRVLAKHWPNARRYEDVRQVGAHNLPACDLLCGGFPCQDISVAGKQAGIDGARSGLWTEYARIIGELRPRFVVVENVAALRHGGMGRVLGDLAACGYDAIWDCIPAQAVSAPHRRDRLFIVAWAVSDTDSQPVPTVRGQRAITEGKGSDGAALRIRRNGDAERQAPIRSTGQLARAFRRALAESQEPWAPESTMDRVVPGVLSGVDRNRHRCLGNAVVPQVAEVVGRVVLQLAGGAP